MKKGQLMPPARIYMPNEPARRIAYLAGQVRYVSTTYCTRGHVGERYTKTNACVKCTLLT